MTSRPETTLKTTGAGDGVSLSVIVPMYREAARIGITMSDLVPALAGGTRMSELILVDDGSDDATRQAVAQWLTQTPSGALQRVALIGYEHNRGKGAAVREGLRAAIGRWRLIMDADNSCRVREVERLFDVATRTGAALIAGSRRVPDSVVTARLSRRVLGGVFHAANRALGIGLLRDTQCGFKLYRADLVDSILPHTQEDRYLFDLEHLLLARMMGYALAEVGVAWEHRDGGQVSPIRDGVKMFLGSVALRRRLGILESELRRAHGAVPEPTVRRIVPSRAADQSVPR